MERQARRRLDIEASATDPNGGIARLVTDAERFGFAQIAMTISPNSSAMIRMTPDVASSIDCAVVTQRFSRHPALDALGVADLPQGQPPAAGRASMHRGEWMRP